MNFSFRFTRIFALTAILSTSQFAFAQTPAKWSVNGNATVNGDFLGTTNNNPVIFYANNQEWMRLKANGELKINSLSGSGDNFIFSNSNGVLYSKPFTTDTNKFLTEAGVFRTASSFTGWKFNGNNIHTINGSFVGVGTNNPQYQLDVNGDARFNGTLYSQGLVLATNMQADTVKSTSMISVNNNLSFYSGLVNDIYTLTGDVRLQSRVGYIGNTILNAGNNGNVGIGIYSPLYKFDVNGDARVSGSIRTQRIRPLPGDTVVIIGDSSIWVSSSNKIFPYGPSTIYRGIAIGNLTSTAKGLNSLAIGSGVWTTSTADRAIIIGSGAPNFNMKNDIANSLMIGFNSNIPTVFVKPASGLGTIGRVGIGTTDPQGDFQVGDGLLAKFCVRTDGKVGIGTTNPQGDFQIGDGSGMKFCVQTGGRVIIGPETILTTSPFNSDPATRLTVDGRIMCKDIVVSIDADWPDYVFDSKYVLTPLDTVAKFVETNNHLPGSVPAATIEQNGFSLSETAIAQQKQLEEMMLYILQLNERMKALEAENANLKAQGNK